MCCLGINEIDTNAVDKARSIDKELAIQRKKLGEEIKLLLLGSGESGKSTIAKQMRIIHLGGFNPEEKAEYIGAVHMNIYESVQAIVKASKNLQIPLSRESEEFALPFLESFSSTLSPEQGERITLFWEDPAVQQIAKRRSEFQLLDNTEYFVKELQRICEKGYVPNEADVLRSRVQTTGVIETSFITNDRKFILVDVGGQRSERKKWIHCFENVSGVLFCVGISAFDQTLYEDNKTNRLHEALKLFREICMSKWFTNTAIILFLNKDDIFRQKLAEGKKITVAFPEYSGSGSYSSSIEFLHQKFTDVIDPVTQEKRNIYVHVTCATDTQNVQVVFEAVKDFVMGQALVGSGLIV